MNSRLSIIGLILSVIGFAMLLGNFIPPCESNSSIQTLWTRACDFANLVLFMTATYLAYAVFLVGVGFYLTSIIKEKMMKSNYSSNSDTKHQKN